MNKEYPIYKISASWFGDPYSCTWIRPNQLSLRGKEKNGTSTYYMFPNDPTSKDLEAYSKEWIEKNILKHRGVEQVGVKIEFIFYETWCMSWFSHYTYDTDLSDQEALTSFEEYVQRMIVRNWKNGHKTNEPTPKNDKQYYCLMGAEDRWRWVGDPETEEQPPCRCKHCMKAGVIRIGH